MMAKWEKFENLNPRIGMSLGATIPLPGYANVKPSVSLEIDVPEGCTLEEAYVMVEAELTSKLREIADHLEAEIGSR